MPSILKNKEKRITTDTFTNMNGVLAGDGDRVYPIAFPGDPSQFLDGSGNFSTPSGGGGGSPGGSVNDVQINDGSGGFYGDDNFYYDPGQKFVGIGRIPTQALDVYNDISGGGVIIQAVNANDADASYAQISMSVGGNSGFAFYKYGPNGYAGSQQNGVGINNFDAGPVSFFTNNTLRGNIDGSTGFYAIGHNSALSILHVVEPNGSSGSLPRGIMIEQNDSSANAPLYLAQKSRGSHISPTAVTNGDGLWNLICRGYDGTSWLHTAQIIASVDSAVTTGSIGTGLNFYTGSSGGGTLRFNINSSGLASYTGEMRVSTAGTASTSVVNNAGTQTLTNKRITKRVTVATNATSITPNTNNADWTEQANTQALGTITINADAGTPTNKQAWGLEIKSTNVQTFSWNSQYVGGTNPLPTATTGGGKIDFYTFIYSTTNSKWIFTGSQTNVT